MDSEKCEQQIRLLSKRAALAAFLYHGDPNLSAIADKLGVSRKGAKQIAVEGANILARLGITSLEGIEVRAVLEQIDTVPLERLVAPKRKRA